MPLSNLFKRKKNVGKIFTGSTVGIPPAFDMQNIAMGLQKTVVMQVLCGGCEKEWKDAIVPNQETIVTCPHCGGKNKVTLHAKVFFVK